MPIDPKLLYQVYAVDTQPRGPVHQWMHVHTLLQIVNEATTAARTLEPLRRDVEEFANAVGKRAIAIGNAELKNSLDCD
jgi:hypothetical protein